MTSQKVWPRRGSILLLATNWPKGGWVFGLIALLFAGCATPVELFARRVDALEFSLTTVPGTSFRHVLAQTGESTEHGIIRVYVEHDGVPWLRPDVVSNDPSPRFPMALEMMARDLGHRVYLGRPCYFGLSEDPGCEPRVWTDGRYSEEVIRSMAAVVNGIVAGRGSSSFVVLIGYSGGGTIAWLMARHIPAAKAVVTVAANLDVEAWTTLHRFTPLAGSLNPATAAPLPAGIRQLHMAGGQDTNVAPAIVRSVALRQSESRFVEIAEFDHVCCWLERWPALMQGVVANVSP